MIIVNKEFAFVVVVVVVVVVVIIIIIIIIIMISVISSADKRACSHTVHHCSTFFTADISQAKNGELLIVVYCCMLLYMCRLATWRCVYVR